MWTQESLRAHLASLSPQERAETMDLLRRVPAFVDPAFPEQTAFVTDPARFLLLFGTRRSGKSFALGRRLLYTAWRKPNSTLLYVGLTKEGAMKILWRPVIERLNEELRLGAKPNKTELSWSLPNGSVIYFVGLDANEKQKDKVYGQKFTGVAIDEAALYTVDMPEFIYGTLKAALADDQGWLVLSGMPSSYQSSLFYDLTNVWSGGAIREGEAESQDANDPGTWELFDGREITWRGHRWGALNNPYMRSAWEGELQQALDINPQIVDDPVFIQNMLGRWSVDPALLVIKYRASKNTLGELPKGAWPWRRIMGIDLGWDDPSAFVVCYYRDGDPTLYVVEARKSSSMDLVDVQAQIVELEKIHGAMDLKVVDGASKQAVETIRRRLKVNLRNAPKGEKWEHLQLMSADFQEGTVKLLPKAKPLGAELSKLVRDPHSDLPKPKAGLPDHCVDALLYAWRYCHHYVARPGKPPPPEPEFGTDEWAEREKQARFRNLQLVNRMPDY